MAARNLLIEEPLAERTKLLKELIEAGTGMRELWLKEIEAARAGEEGLRLIVLGENWVRFEDDASSEALKCILERNRPTSKGASA